MEKCCLYDRVCIECGECRVCDLDPNKICDNCEACLETFGLEYSELIIDEVDLAEAAQKKE